MKQFIIGFFYATVLFGVAACGFRLIVPHYADITWYKDGSLTASGEPFLALGSTMAVKHYGDMGYWYKVSYRGKKVYVWANDILPAKAKADFDLSLGAFQKLADPKVGRISAVVERVK